MLKRILSLQGIISGPIIRDIKADTKLRTLNPKRPSGHAGLVVSDPASASRFLPGTKNAQKGAPIVDPGHPAPLKVTNIPGSAIVGKLWDP